MWDICSEAKTRECRSTVHHRDPTVRGVELAAALNPGDSLSAAHQCHDVVGQVSGQVRGHETRQAGEGDAGVVLVGAAEILGDGGGK